ncbi:hypothetical protein [Acetivibrio sp.]|uniref:hypothetical protein n=1 Tax=Acetivibrio sp. TaxID=1872092 RepID=UPI002D1FB9F6|nr:hypothetical protein [Acetivibrio sp.]
MMFPPTKVPEDGDVFKVFPELKKNKEFVKSPGPGLDNNKVMLWIMCMYDKNTPYRVKYKDVLKRKIEIAHDVGFEMENTGVFIPPVEEMLKGMNEKVNRKIVEFIRMQRSFKYAFFVGIENSYYNILLEVISGNTKRLNELKAINEELEETLINLLNDDNNPYLKDTILRYIEEERLALRPEDIALKRAKGEDPIPYKEVFG